MFTALHRDRDTEVLYPCIEIVRSRRAPNAPRDGSPEPGVYLTLIPGHAAKNVFIPDAKCGEVGREPPCVIVMNDNGKTVAKYDL